MTDRAIKREEWKDKNLAVKTESIATLKRLSKHNSEFVRLAVLVNRKIPSINPVGYQQLLLEIARRDHVTSIRDIAIEKLIRLKNEFF